MEYFVKHILLKNVPLRQNFNLSSKVMDQ